MERLTISGIIAGYLEHAAVEGLRQAVYKRLDIMSEIETIMQDGQDLPRYRAMMARESVKLADLADLLREALSN